MATDSDDVMTRSDDYEWTIPLRDKDGDPLPLRSIEVRIVAKPLTTDLADDTDALYVHRATFGADGAIANAVGIRVVGSPDDGVIEEFLTGPDKIALAAVYDGFRQRGVCTLGRYDVQVLDATGRRKTLLSGELAMRRDVGRSS